MTACSLSPAGRDSSAAPSCDTCSTRDHASPPSTATRGTQTLAEAAADAGVKRILYVSHLGADRMSAFPVLKAKGIAEEYIRRGGGPHTILPSSIVLVPEDR